jgi:adenosylcobinamide-GDP ribazoletransferase
MKNFFSALTFLTIIPGPKEDAWSGQGMIAFFPVVGLFIGGGLFAVHYLGGLIFSVNLQCLFDVLYLAVITGGLHLDGLADTADGVFSHRGKERALEIMRDPSVGVMGVLALVFVLAFKFFGLQGLDSKNIWVWLVLAPALGRFAQLLGLVFMQDARETAGLGASMYAPGKYAYLSMGLIPLGLPFWINIQTGIFVLVIFSASCLAIFGFFKLQLGGMTGDTFGAMSETIETIILIVGGVAVRFLP